MQQERGASFEPAADLGRRHHTARALASQPAGGRFAYGAFASGPSDSASRR